MIWIALISYLYIGANGQVDVYETQSKGSFPTHEACMQDAARAVSYISAHAKEAGVIGFTAVCKPQKAV